MSDPTAITLPVLSTAGPVPDSEPSASDLTQAEEALRCFSANTLGLLCIAGFDGYFKRLNSAWETALGWTVDELRAKPFIEFVHPGDHAATRAEFERLTAGHRTIQFENRYRCRDGSWKWLSWNAYRLRSQRQISAIATDITRHRRMQTQLLEAGDREKERLGRELHDGLCQNLAGIAALSTTLSRKLAADSEPAAAEAREIAQLLNETIGHARDMARGLNPVNLEKIGIAAALEGLAENVEALFPVSCVFLCHHPETRLAPEVGAHLYRIAQEAVNNAVTHGRGRQIGISLSFRDGEGRLSIRDDGVGISGEPVTIANQGTGLQSMDYRSRLIGGTLELRRRTLCGTKVICRFPLPKA